MSLRTCLGGMTDGGVCMIYILVNDMLVESYRKCLQEDE